MGLVRLGRELPFGDPGCFVAGTKGKSTGSRTGASFRQYELFGVIRALLVAENAGRRWTQRKIQLHCEPSVSLGLVNKVVRYLRDEAFIESSDDGFRVRDPERLLFAWCDAYRLIAITSAAISP